MGAKGAKNREKMEEKKETYGDKCAGKKQHGKNGNGVHG